MNVYETFSRDFEGYIFQKCEEFTNIEDLYLVEMYHYAISSGRRYRPMLVLTGWLLGKDTYNDLTIALATAIEFIHKYSLILDDYVDNDTLRRGQQTFFSKYGRDNAQALSAYLMNLFFKELNQIKAMVGSQRQLMEIDRLYEQILSDMSVGFICDLNQHSKDLRGVKKISAMQTSTLLRNSLMIGYCASQDNLSLDNSQIYQLLYDLGDRIGTVFQAYNDLEMFFGKDYQMANKGILYSDFAYNRKNILIEKVPKQVRDSRNTTELVNYINRNGLIRIVFDEILQELQRIETILNSFPERSAGTLFLNRFLLKKKSVLLSLSTKELSLFNDTSKISAI